MKCTVRFVKTIYSYFFLLRLGTGNLVLRYFVPIKKTGPHFRSNFVGDLKTDTQRPAVPFYQS